MSTPPVPFPGSYWAVPGKLLAGFYPGARDHMEAAAKITALLNSGNGQLTDIFFSSDLAGYRRTWTGFIPVGLGSRRFKLDGKVREDRISKDRNVDGRWSNCDIEGNPLLLEMLPSRSFTRRERTLRSHVYCSFLALALRKKLDRCLEQSGQHLEWADMKALCRATIEESGKRFAVPSQSY